MTEDITIEQINAPAETVEMPEISIADEMKALFDKASTEAPKEEPKAEPTAEAKKVEEKPAEKPVDEKTAIIEKELPLVPASWSKEEKEVFAKLAESDNEDVRLAYEIMAERASQMQSGMYKKFEEIAQERKTYAGFNEALKPFESNLKQNNITPAHFVQNLLSEIQQLNNNPAGKVKELIKNYNLTPEQLGFDSDLSLDFTDVQKDDTVEQLKAEIKNLRNELHQKIEVAPLQNEVTQFVNAKDAQGKPLHPHFEIARHTMAGLMQSDANLDLKGAYTKAVIALGLAESSESQDKITDIQKLREKVAKSVKASRAVKTANSTPDYSKMSIREELLARASGSI